MNGTMIEAGRGDMVVECRFAASSVFACESLYCAAMALQGARSPWSIKKYMVAIGRALPERKLDLDQGVD